MITDGPDRLQHICCHLRGLGPSQILLVSEGNPEESEVVRLEPPGEVSPEVLVTMHVTASAAPGPSWL